MATSVLTESRAVVIERCFSLACSVGSTITELEVAQIVDFALERIREGSLGRYFKAGDLPGRPIARSVDILEDGRFVIHLNQMKGADSSKTRDRILGTGSFKKAKYSVDSSGTIVVRSTTGCSQDVMDELQVTREFQGRFAEHSSFKIGETFLVRGFISKSCRRKVEILSPFYYGHLEELLANKSLDIHQRIALAKSLICFVKEAHRQWLAHGDLWPKNMFLDPRYGLVIIDFGLGALPDSPTFENTKIADLKALTKNISDLLDDPSLVQADLPGWPEIQSVLTNPQQRPTDAVLIPLLEKFVEHAETLIHARSEQRGDALESP